jgi:nucleotide-binding universal stress UspA family protein
MVGIKPLFGPVAGVGRAFAGGGFFLAFPRECVVNFFYSIFEGPARGGDMQREVLVAVSRDGSAWYGLRFVSWFFRNKKSFRVALMCIARDPAAGREGLRFSHEREELERQSRVVREESQKALEDACAYLMRAGFPARNVKSTVRISEFGTVQDLVGAAERGLYDALVLGRRGLGRLEALMRDSVSAALLAEEVTFPIWLCRTPAPDRSNVLVCVDGSASSIAAADHVGFMVADEPDHAVTLFTVQDDPDAAHAALEQGRAALEANGVAPERIVHRVVRGGNVVEAVLAEADAGPYAAVAVGRAGLAGRGRGAFLGSVGVKLMRTLERSALWVVY